MDTNRVVVAGSINMDIVARVVRHPVPGETIAGKELAYFPGGKGANQAVAAARAGADVVVLGALGDDAFSAELSAFLATNGVQTEMIAKVHGQPSGTALIIVDNEGENAIVVVPGANAEVDETCVSQVPLTKSDVLVAQFETPVASTIAFFKQGLTAGATRILNPAPAVEIEEALLRLTNVLILNETELAIVTKADLPDAPGAEDVRNAGQVLRGLGFDGCLVVTLGARGSMTLVGDRLITIEGRQVSAHDTTGAGDCFVGYLGACLARGLDLDRALSMANAAASICVQRAGAGPSMPMRDEVEALLG